MKNIVTRTRKLKQQLVLKDGKRYSDQATRFSMIPNWLFDDGKYLDLDPYERLTFMYAIRLVNQKQDEGNRKDYFAMSYKQVAENNGFSERLANDVVKSLIEKGFLQQLSTGNSFRKEANTYKIIYKEPEYIEGEAISIQELLDRGMITQDEYLTYEYRNINQLYYHEMTQEIKQRRFMPVITEM